MTTTMTTRSRMFIAAGWLIGSNLSAQALRLASSLVLTRLLLPDAFGLMAAVNTLYFGLVMFSDLGVWQSIVKTKHSPSLAFLGTAWTVQLVRSGILAFIVALIAAGLMLAQRWGWPPAGSIYADPRLPLLILVFVLSAGLQGAESMKIALVQRSMDLKPLARMEVLSQLGATLLTIALAITFRSIWALAIGTVFSSMLRTVLSHTLLHGPAIRPVWSIEHAAEILSFGRWIFVSSIIGFLAAHGEKLILAAFLSTTAFGVFSIASTLLAALIGLYSSVNGHVVFSSLSETLRANDPVKLRTMYRRVQQSADFLLGAMAGCLFSAGHWVVWFLYDARYSDAGWMLQVLALGLLAMRFQVMEQLMFAKGRPDLVTLNNLSRALALFVFIPLGYQFDGDRGAIWGIVCSQFASWPICWIYQWRHQLLSWRQESWGWGALALGYGAGLVLDHLFQLLFKLH